ncbi:UNVERIFIED_CONTAM: hypothetical protein K2H54_037333 [Gekko kuhli]
MNRQRRIGSKVQLKPGTARTDWTESGCPYFSAFLSNLEFLGTHSVDKKRHHSEQDFLKTQLVYHDLIFPWFVHCRAFWDETKGHSLFIQCNRDLSPLHD